MCRRRDMLELLACSGYVVQKELWTCVNYTLLYVLFVTNLFTKNT